MSNHTPSHNLRIDQYTLDELLGLFDLKSYEITLEQLKAAKKRVLMLHPDKSRLGPEYFLFYKKAFEVVVQFYEEQNRQNQVIDENTTKYKPVHTNDQGKKAAHQIEQVIGKMPTETFQNKFNQLFEQNGMAQRPDPTKNQWFQDETPVFQDVPKQGQVSGKNMGQVFDTIKQNQSLTMVQEYRGVQEMRSTMGGGSASFHDDHEEEAQNHYISSDPFSKLKFDDLRKVHKDQTVFAVSERDFEKVQTYGSVEEFNRARAQHSYDPLAEEKAKRILLEQEKAYKDAMMRKEYAAKLRTKEFEEKNRNVLASFLQLQNS
jgi:hypothetical protein